MTTYRNTDTENYTTGVCNIGIGRNRKRKNFCTVQKNCDLLELTLHEAIIEIYGDNTEIIYPIMLEAITNENVTYEYLSMQRNIPCGKYLYWKIRRRFYYLLDRKK